uniref:Olfactory receptor n=1 Tax=Alligator sinensis TaxID=38654 RepID=A0A7D3QLN6_ALLSI|nr:olfactory receptor 49-like protein [Alligator sinensis]
MQNQTAVTQFILLGFTDVRWMQLLLFAVLLLIYFLTIMGNIIIISITLIDVYLQTPMYFFLRNFSILEIGFTSISIPKMLANLVMDSNTISISSCFVQLFFYFLVGIAELFLLAVMSLDRYVAICHPLRYPVIMNRNVCIHLVVWSWVGSFMSVFFTTVVITQLPFCGPNIINHFFCDNSPLLKLACTDTRLIELVDFIIAIVTVLGTLSITVVSYVHIISAILSMPTKTGQQKAFSTCASHLMVVFITYGSCIFMYVKPAHDGKLDFNKAAAIFNNVISPLLNPFIYSLRNKQVQKALRKAFGQRAQFFKGLR